MWRIIKFIFTGRWKLPEICQHHWKFVDVQPYRDTSYLKQGEKGVKSVMFVRVCALCGEHERGDIYGCTARTPNELNTMIINGEHNEPS